MAPMDQRALLALTVPLERRVYKALWARRGPLVRKDCLGQ